MNNCRKNIFLPVICLLIACYAFSTEYVIVQEVYAISGRSKQQYIQKAIGNAEGMHFSSKNELERFIEKRRNKIEDLRTFKSFSLQVEYAEPDNALGIIPVILTLTIVDGIPFMAYPTPSFNSNTGFMMGILAQFPNIGGTMQDLTLMGMYIAPPNKNGDLQWLHPDFNAMFQLSKIRLPFIELSVTGVFSKNNQRIEARGEEKIKFSQFRVMAAVEAKYKLTEELSVSLGLSGRKTFDVKLDEVIDSDFLPYGPLNGGIGVNSTLKYSDYTWIDNFRDGFVVAGTVGYTKNYPLYSHDRNDFWFVGYTAFYKLFWDIFNPNVRALGFIHSDLANINSANYVRGIKDREITANTGFVISLDTQVRLFGNKSVEFHLSPNVDFIFAHAWNVKDYANESGFGVGAELYIFISALKSLPIRMGFAYDLRPKYGNDVGKRFEIDMNMSYSY